jgi:hypothetical protein
MRYHHTMPDDNEKPATKADISLLRAELSTKTELAAVKTELAAVKTELTAQINRVAAALVNTQTDVREIRNDMATKDDVGRILSAIDAFAKKSENQSNAVALHGHVLTEVQVGLKDHESSIKTLESARP